MSLAQPMWLLKRPSPAGHHAFLSCFMSSLPPEQVGAAVPATNLGPTGEAPLSLPFGLNSLQVCGLKSSFQNTWSLLACLFSTLKAPHDLLGLACGEWHPEIQELLHHGQGEDSSNASHLQIRLLEQKHGPLLGEHPQHSLPLAFDLREDLAMVIRPVGVESICLA